MRPLRDPVGAPFMAPWPHGKFRAALFSPQGRINAAPTGARRGAIILYEALRVRRRAKP